jgi:hypothetical protein
MHSSKRKEVPFFKENGTSPRHNSNHVPTDILKFWEQQFGILV